MHPVYRRIEKHLRATGLPPTRFGREAVGDPRIVGDLRNGREPGPAIARSDEQRGLISTPGDFPYTGWDPEGVRGGSP